MESSGKTFGIIVLGLLVIIFVLLFNNNHQKTKLLMLEGKRSRVNAMNIAVVTQNKKLKRNLTDKILRLEKTEEELKQMTRDAESNTDTVELLSYENEQLKGKVSMLEKTAARQRRGLGIFDDHYKEKIAAYIRTNQKLAQDKARQTVIIADKDKKLYYCIQANDKLLSENSKRQIMITKLEDKLRKNNPSIIKKAPFTIRFDLNRWDICGQEKKNLEHDAEWLLEYWKYALANNLQFCIIGYCCQKGTSTYNWGVVGSKRALTVERAFIKALINDGATKDEVNKLLRPLSAGKYRPEHNKPCDNRKVEIYLLKKPIGS